MNYLDIIQVGVSILFKIVVGFICIKFKFIDYDAVAAVNRFMLYCCYPPMLFRSVGSAKIKEINFTPFLIGTLIVLSIYIVSASIFLIPSKYINNKFKHYLSSALPTNYTNYLIIGIPFFEQMWPQLSTVMVTVINLSNDIICAPIYLILVSIYKIREANEEHKAKGDDIVEKFSFKTIGIILLNIIKNPIVIGNVVGFLWSGAEWTICPFLKNTANFLADGVVTLVLFCVGGFLSKFNLVACPWPQFIFCIFQKIILMPLFGLLFSLAFNLDKDLAYQCTLMPLMPTATASFMLAFSNDTGPGASSTMIFFTTILVVPAIIAWIAVLDSTHVFE